MANLNFKKFTLQRIDAFIHQIELLNEIDFPYKDSNEALSIISDHIKKQRDDVDSSLLTGDHLKSRCSVSTNELSKFHRFLGYIAKSSDPINSFEIYFSFRRIAESILGKDVRLIINSDWESYSPINFNRPLQLIDFIFIGLPVSESNNSLIVPLAGHELGHSVWFNELNGSSFEQKYRQELQSELQASLSTRFSSEDISFIVDISLDKCAEYFCDFIALGIFGESYLYAFAYLLAPRISKQLTSSHPNASNRANALLETAKDFGYNCPKDFQGLFKTLLISKPDEGLRISEETSFQKTPNLRLDVMKLLSEKSILYKRSTKFGKIKAELLSMVPTSSANSLADVVNAAWEINFRSNKWNVLKTEKEKGQLLNELVFKSFEILEIKQRLK